MSGPALTIIPSDWDTDFFLQLTTVTNSYGFDFQADGIHFRYLAEDFDAVQAAVTNYPVQYLSVKRPLVLIDLKNYRDNKILNFTYNGTPVPMDPESRANLTGAALGLQRNPDVTQIHWKIAEGTYVALPAAMVLDMADQAFKFVEGCFSHEADLASQINAAADINALAAIDITQGWPLYPGQTG